MEREKSEYCALEELERRAHLSGGPLCISPLPGGGSGQWLVMGTAGADDIRVNRSADGCIVVSNGGEWSTPLPASTRGLTVHGGAGNDRIEVDASITIPMQLYGDAGNDTIIAGGGDTHLYGGAGNDLLIGGAGDCTLVDVDAGRDTLIGGAGHDNFWAGAGAKVTASADEISGGMVHRINAFYSPASSKARSSTRDPLSQKLTEPAITDVRITWHNFSSRPLFASKGPSPDDVAQGVLGDCYLLGARGRGQEQAGRPRAVDHEPRRWHLCRGVPPLRPRAIRASRCQPAGCATGALAYADLGKGGSLWVALYEKAYAIFRTGQGTYASLNGGWMSEVNTALGLRSATQTQFASAASLLKWIGQEINHGRAVTVGTREPHARRCWRITPIASMR